MNRFYVTFEASASYVTTAPTVQVLVNGAVISSGMITGHTGVGTTLLSFGLDFPSGSLYPATLSFRFQDGSGESRTVTVTNITVNGQPVDTTYISMLSLTQGQSSAVNTAPIDHLFGRVEPTLPDLPTPDIVGTASNDLLVDGAARAVISAGAGNDQVRAGAGDNIVSGGAGNDTILGGAGNELLSGDADNDYIFGAAGNDLIYGGAGTDVLIGGLGDDIINGGADNDTLLGEAGADVLYGEAGDDKLLGHAGNDYMYGDAGVDWMDGGANDDTMYGGTGNDLMSGAGGNDTMYGDDDDDDMDGGAGNDTMTGGLGVDRISGGLGNDTLNGGDGNDLLMGDAGTDTLNGDNNDDALLGGAGADTLNGGAGSDTLYGSSLSLAEASVPVNSIANLSFNLATNSFYRHISGAVNYAAAKAAAEAATIVVNGVTYYGHLVTITSAVENTYVDSLIGATMAWMGATDSVVEGTWRWVGGIEDGIQFSSVATAQNNFYTNWAVGEPNDTGNSDGAVLDVDGKWYDRPVGNTAGYVIEWDGINIGDDNAADILSGGAGTDTLYGGGGNDTLNGGTENDQLFGGLGDDTLNGDDGNDFLQDHAGTNTFNGGIGNDILDARYQGAGAAPTIGVQTMNGGAGDDTIHGGSGNDIIHGDADNDTLYGYDGDDTIYGDAGTDTLYAGNGNDTLYGDAGADTLYGGAGTDVLYGGADNDTINSGSVDTLSSQISTILAANAGVFFDYTTGNFYKYVNTNVTWTAANTAATGSTINGVAGHLAHITSAYENSMIDTLLGTDEGWIGAIDTATEGTFVYSGGVLNNKIFWIGTSGGSAQNFFYTNWLAGQPDNGGNADYVFFSSTGTWEDEKSTGKTKNSYVIEWEGTSVLTPTETTTLSGGAGTDSLYGSAGCDIFQFETTTVGTNDTIYSYNIGHLDKLDIGDLLTGYVAGTSDVDAFARFTVSGANLLLQIDANGATGGASFSTIATLNALGTSNLNVEEMVAKGLMIMT